MKDEDKIIDWRSTGRRKARKELFVNYVDYKCTDCGRSTIEPPKDAPPWFEELWPEEKRVLTSQLEADHETKDLTVNDINDLNWRCKSCHKLRDMQTEKGISTKEEEDFGFSNINFDEY